MFPMHGGFMGKKKGVNPCAYVPGLYTQAEVDDLINIDGYIPVADADEFDKIRTGAVETMGGCSIWAGSYTTGADKNYIQIFDIDFAAFGNWGGGNEIGAFVGTYDGNELWIENVTQLGFALFVTTTNGKLLNCRIRNSSSISPTNAYGLNRGNIATGIEITNFVCLNYTISAGVLGAVCSGRATYTDCNINASISAIAAGSGHYGSGGGIFTRCVASGTLTQSGTGNQFGAFLGQCDFSSTFTECRSSVAATTTRDQCGGFIGRVSGASVVVTMTNCVFDGSINGRNAIGGLIADYAGGAGSTITNCIMYGNLSATGALFGGLCSRILSGTLTASNSYWDTTLGPATSVVGTGQTTTALQTPTSNTGIYSAWDAAIWDFGTSTDYPELINNP